MLSCIIMIRGALDAHPKSIEWRVHSSNQCITVVIRSPGWMSKEQMESCVNVCCWYDVKDPRSMEIEGLPQVRLGERAKPISGLSMNANSVCRMHTNKSWVVRLAPPISASPARMSLPSLYVYLSFLQCAMSLLLSLPRQVSRIKLCNTAHDMVESSIEKDNDKV